MNRMEYFKKPEEIKKAKEHASEMLFEWSRETPTSLAQQAASIGVEYSAYFKSIQMKREFRWTLKPARKFCELLDITPSELFFEEKQKVVAPATLVFLRDALRYTSPQVASLVMNQLLTGPLRVGGFHNDPNSQMESTLATRRVEIMFEDNEVALNTIQDKLDAEQAGLWKTLLNAARQKYKMGNFGEFLTPYLRFCAVLGQSINYLLVDDYARCGLISDGVEWPASDVTLASNFLSLPQRRQEDIIALLAADLTRTAADDEDLLRQWKNIDRKSDV